MAMCVGVCVCVWNGVRERDKEREIDHIEVLLPCECCKGRTIMQMSGLNVVGHHPACH